MFVETSKKDALMGDRIEHVDYVTKSLEAANASKRLHVDTKLYIQNQILKPCLQLLAIALEQLPGYVPRADLTGPGALEVLVKAKGGDRVKARERLNALREREVERLIFAPVLAHKAIRDRDNRCAGQSDLHRYFSKAS